MLRVGQIVEGRWRVISPLPAGRELLRWFGREQETGRVVEILRPKSLVPLRRRRAIVAGFRAVQGDPAVSPILHVGTQGVIIREMPPERTLRNLDAPLRPQQAVELAAWLGPAVLAMAPVLGGRLDRDELALCADGVVRLAPGRHRASDGAPPRSALGALGALLYELLAGCPPEEPLRPLHLHMPKIPPEVEDVVTGLLSEDPVLARAALPPRPDQAPLVLQPIALGVEAAETRGLSTASRPAYAVVVEPASLGLVGRKRFSEAMGLPVAVFNEFIDAKLPLPVASAQTRPDAEIWIEELAELRVQAQIVARGERFRLGWLLQTSPLLLAGAIAVAAGLWPLGAAAVVGAAVMVAWHMKRESDQRDAVVWAYEKLESLEPEAQVPLEDLLASVAVSRSSVLHDLSSTAAPGVGREGIRTALRSALVQRSSPSDRTSGA